MTTIVALLAVLLIDCIVLLFRHRLGRQEACAPHCGNAPHCGYLPHCGSRPQLQNQAASCGESGLVCLGKIRAWLGVLGDWWKAFKGIRKSESAGAKTDKMRVAYISNYGTPCGIATYNAALLQELRLYADVRVFAEYADETCSQRLDSDPSWVTRCWRRNDHPKANLIRQVAAWQPDIVHFSHEYGHWPLAYQFTQVVSELRARGFRILATMHSVYDHLDKLVTEAIVPNVMVHTDQARVTLIKKGVADSKITVIPHGSPLYRGTADAPQLLENLWNTWGSEHTIYQPGFLFGYKGHLRMLGVVAKLKEKYADVHYIIQASENPTTACEHEALYQQLINECARLGITGNVTIHRGFVATDVLLANIRTVKACVLPYNNHPEHDVRATSGIARMVLATKTPLVVTGVHLFDDLEGIVCRVRDDQELYQALDRIFSDSAEAEAQIARRTDFLRKTSWESVAHRVHTLYRRILDL